MYCGLEQSFAPPPSVEASQLSVLTESRWRPTCGDVEKCFAGQMNARPCRRGTQHLN